MLLLNGAIVQYNSSQMYGASSRGVFETFLVKKIDRNSAAVIGLDRHIERLLSGARHYDISVPDSHLLKKDLTAALRAYEWKTAQVRARFILLPGERAVQIDELPQVKESYSLKSIRMSRENPEIKYCPASVSLHSQAEAQSSGADEALLVDERGIVTETSWGNFFWVDGAGQIFTAGRGILKGVTREIVLQLNTGIIEGEFTLEEVLNSSRGAFLTSSLRGVKLISKIDNTLFPIGWPGTFPIYEGLQFDKRAVHHCRLVF